MGEKTKDLLTKAEAGEVLGVAVRTIESYVTNGHLRTVSVPLVGRKMGTRISKAEIRRFQRDLERRAG